MMNISMHTFVNGIYPRRLYIVKGKVSADILNDNFKKEYTDNNVSIVVPNDCNACVYDGTMRYIKDDTLGVLLLIQNKLSIADIAHESVHVAENIFDQIGACFDYQHQEPFAYLVGWCADCINQVNRNKFKD